MTPRRPCFVVVFVGFVVVVDVLALGGLAYEMRSIVVFRLPCLFSHPCAGFPGMRERAPIGTRGLQCRFCGNHLPLRTVCLQ